MRMTWGLLLGLPGLPHYTINGWSSHPLIVAPPGKRSDGWQLQAADLDPCGVHGAP